MRATFHMNSPGLNPMFRMLFIGRKHALSLVTKNWVQKIILFVRHGSVYVRTGYRVARFGSVFGVDRALFGSSMISARDVPG